MASVFSNSKEDCWWLSISSPKDNFNTQPNNPFELYQYSYKFYNLIKEDMCYSLSQDLAYFTNSYKIILFDRNPCHFLLILIKLIPHS